MFAKLKNLLLGRALDPMNPDAKKHIALIAVLAWVGLGADGLSSACYGPEEAFLALGNHHHALGFWLAIISALTVFVISLAYNQVIQLFPNGGGGYRVATHLLGKYAGLVSGVALIIDYMMTVAISIASGVDAVFSFLPAHWLHAKLSIEIVVLALLTILNLRGAKESIKVLLPIFLGFFLTHVAIIIYGIVTHGEGLPAVAHDSVIEAHGLYHSMGAIAFFAFFMRAYSMGAGTYTGLEAVSNNVNILKEPRVSTGRWTMFYMALSLSFTAGGIMLLYLLWHAQPVHGMTLNAVVFDTILGQHTAGHISLVILLLFEAGILFVGANTGFLGGPAVMSNMAQDKWAPERFGLLSSRLVTQNGIIFFAILAAIVLLWTKGHVSLLVVLYSINVFITFSLSLFGLCVYWLKHRPKRWLSQFALAAIGFVVCMIILCMTIITKFTEGGWITLAITLIGIICCFAIARYYKRYQYLKHKLNQSLCGALPPFEGSVKALDPNDNTAVFFVKEAGSAMHTLLWAERMFPDHFKNFIFVSHANVDSSSFGSEKKLEALQATAEDTLRYLVDFSRAQGKCADSMLQIGTEPLDDLAAIATSISQTYPHSLFFAASYIFPRETWFTRVLHSGLAQLLQRRLHREGIKLLTVPLNLE